MRTTHTDSYNRILIHFIILPNEVSVAFPLFEFFADNSGNILQECYIIKITKAYFSA